MEWSKQTEREAHRAAAQPPAGGRRPPRPRRGSRAESGAGRDPAADELQGAHDDAPRRAADSHGPQAGRRADELTSDSNEGEKEGSNVRPPRAVEPMERERGCQPINRSIMHHSVSRLCLLCVYLSLVARSKERAEGGDFKAGSISRPRRKAGGRQRQEEGG